MLLDSRADVDVEAASSNMGSEGYQDDAVFELQPRLSLPLYYEPPVASDEG